MNREQLRAMLWLRWRIRINQLKKGGVVNTVLLVLLAIGLSLLAIGLFVGFFLLGLLAFPHFPPEVVLWIWDGMVVIFLFSWMIGLLTELQRTEALSLEKLLHLPVSLTGAFLINYISSLASLTLILFLPPMIALTLALVFTKGPLMLLAFPLLGAFVLMVTALTYQFQGWLASLMSTPRRRRTVIVFVTGGFILLCQIPNLVNVLRPWDKIAKADATPWFSEENQKLSKELSEGRITTAQFNQEHAKLLARQREEREAATSESLRQAGQTTRYINMVLPPAWLPLGAASAAEGAALPAILGTIGMTLIGAASLWRAYRTTLRLYTGQFSAGKGNVATPAALPAKDRKPARNLVEKKLPWLSEQVSAVTMSTVQSLIRAPEAKMLLIVPIIMAVVFGGMLIAHQVDIPLIFRPLQAFVALMLVLVTTIQLLGNQFGFDRGGFRVFVLSPTPRASILFGKNLAFAPLAIGMGLVLVIVLQVVSPMRVADFLAIGPQAISMFLLFCLLANLVSILTPMRIAAGSLKPVSPQLIPVLLQLLFMCLVPAVLALTLLPWAVQALVQVLGHVEGWPICLALALIECAGVVLVYRYALGWQGQLLEAREQTILERVTTKE